MMPMNEIYSLLQHDVLFSPKEMLKLLDRISDLNLFDSSDLYNLLDDFKVKASGEIVERIKHLIGQQLMLILKCRILGN